MHMSWVLDSVSSHTFRQACVLGKVVVGIAVHLVNSIGEIMHPLKLRMCFVRCMPCYLLVLLLCLYCLCRS
jgi:hypothetical protein